MEEKGKVKAEAYKYLSVRSRSESEMVRHLSKNGRSPAMVEAVIGELKREGLLDDEAFSKEWIEAKKAGKAYGPLKIRADLIARGVDREIIDLSLNEDYPSEVQHDLAMALAQNKLASLGEDGLKAIRRLEAYLAGRGFEHNLARQVIREVFKKDSLLIDRTGF